jgi:hypothetical protein
MQNFEDLSKESLIDILYALRESLILDDPEADEDEISDGVWDAKQLLGHFNPRPPEVNYLDEFLKDSLGEDAHLFTSDGKNRENKPD